MAKKVVAQAKKALAKKKAGSEKITTSVDIQVLKLTNEIRVRAVDICNLTARLDAIVAALSTAKPIKRNM